jgi:hypothetical protein
MPSLATNKESSELRILEPCPLQPVPPSPNGGEFHLHLDVWLEEK